MLFRSVEVTRTAQTYTDTLIAGRSSEAHVLSSPESVGGGWSGGAAVRWCLSCSCWSSGQLSGVRRAISARTADSSSAPGTRRARESARRRTARSRQCGVGCSHAPRPARRARGSATSTSPTATTRSSSARPPRTRHPTHVRTGVRGVAGADGRSTGDESTAPSACSLTPAARVGAVRRRCPPRFVVDRIGGVGPDVDAPPGEPGRQPGVLPLPADRQRELVVRDHHSR